MPESAAQPKVLLFDVNETLLAAAQSDVQEPLDEGESSL